MPGLSQLKQFSKDMMSLGNETSLRASRGERPVRVPIPKTIKDINDSDDFIIGMPENESEVEELPVDDDLSDIINPSENANSNSEKTDNVESGGIDLSSLLSPMADTGSDGNAPELDLSDFMDEPEPETENEAESENTEPEEEKKPVSIADMGLEDLLSGTGFDGSDISELEDVNPVSSVNSDEYYTDEELEAVAAPKKIEKRDKKTVGNFDFGDFSDFAKTDKNEESEQTEEENLDLSDISDDVLKDLEGIPGLDLGNESEEKTESEDLSFTEPVENFDIPEELTKPADSSPSDLFDFGTINLGDFADLDPSKVTEPLNDFDYPDENAEIEKPEISDDNAEASPEQIDASGENPEPANEETENPVFDAEEQPKTDSFDDLNLDDLNLDNIEDLGINLDDIGEKTPENQEEKSENENSSELKTLDDIESLDSLEDLDFSENSENSDNSNNSAESAASEDLESLEDIGSLDDIGSFDNLENSEDSANGDNSAASDESEKTDDLAGLDDLGNFEDITGLDDIGSFDDLENSGDSTNAENTENFDDAVSFDDIENAGKTDSDGETENTEAEKSEGSEDFGNFDIPLDLDDIDDIGNFGEGGNSEPSENGEFNTESSDIPDFEEEIPEMDDSGASSEGGDQFDDFDASDLEGLDFSTPSSSSASSNDSPEGFDLGNADDFAAEGSDFEIEGFTDVDIAKEEKTAPKLPTPDFSGALEGTKLPPNTLSDEQYKQFLENLREYPLNVRLAFEDLIVKDEFTDDAEFELIEKVLNKVPARQLAATLEKMLDISLPVPRDYEHRTAAEYEAYKKSLEYQLRNKIIPGALVGMVVVLIGIGIFNFVKNCIYKPVKAINLYKQGYALLQEDEYPQSEMKFNEAVNYRISKKWFFNYARGYREHKQYQRAENIYDRILKSFNHDKNAGIEYANMELYDLANYTKAEEIIRRQILDYHVNDPEGMLLLGDTFLEWGTEKDPSKLEAARQQYATLINLYGTTDVYLSRMMRYFVRTDNLQQVLTLKQTFENNKKFKYDSEDITEVSGYLLDKLYGTVTPAEEYLRNQIEGIRGMLLTAVETNQKNPTAWYNLSRYYIDTNENGSIEKSLQRTIQEFNDADTLKTKDIYNYIDSYKLLGEYYVSKDDYLKAQEQYTEGLSLYTTERDSAGFAGNQKIGQLYGDLADINYFVSKEYKQALANYQHAVDLDFDNPKIRYRIGYIQYRNRNYEEALGSFMRASEGNARHKNLLLAMANTLSLRGDDYAASGYYETLIAMLDDEIADEGVVFPQSSAKHNEMVTNYLYAANNYGVTLHRLAVRTGNSALNGDAIVQFQQSVRAWDALTRNQDTLVKLDGSNLAAENIKYITHPFSDYEPAIYTEINKVLSENEGIK